MIVISEFFKAVDAYMAKRTEFIYLNESVEHAFTDLSQIIVTSLKKQNVVLNEKEMKLLVEEVAAEMFNSLDVIINYSYKQGFADGLMCKDFMKEME